MKWKLYISLKWLRVKLIVPLPILNGFLYHFLHLIRFYLCCLFAFSVWLDVCLWMLLSLKLTSNLHILH